MKEILVFGTFDVLHPGHLKFLKAAALYGSVTVALTTDAGCRQYKGANPCNTYVKRAKRLEMLKSIAHVIPADTTPGKFSVLAKHKYGAVVLGYDQADLERALKKWISQSKLRLKINFAGAYRPDLYKSSKLHRVSR